MKMKVKPGTALNKLQSLGDEVLSLVDSKLTSGVPASQVAAWLQDECKLFPEVKPPSVKKMLERYRKGELRNKTLDRIATAHVNLPLATLQKRLNALDELEEMVRVQRGRVDKMLTLETGKPILLKTTTDEIRLLKDMLMDLGRIQLETGVLARANRTVKGQVIGPSGEVKQFEWTEEQEKLWRNWRVSRPHPRRNLIRTRFRFASTC